MDLLERVATHLRQRLTGVPVSASIPSGRKSLARFVTVSRAGGARTMFLDEPRVVADCHATSIAESYALAEAVADLLARMPDSDPMVSYAGPCSIYRNEWTEDGTPCHTVSCPMVVNV
jgi:hypothetical protein